MLLCRFRFGLSLTSFTDFNPAELDKLTEETSKSLCLGAARTLVSTSVLISRWVSSLNPRETALRNWLLKELFESRSRLSLGSSAMSAKAISSLIGSKILRSSMLDFLLRATSAESS